MILSETCYDDADVTSGRVIAVSKVESQCTKSNTP